MNRSVSKETRQAMLMGLVLGAICVITDAGPAAIYAVALLAVGLFVWTHLGPPEGHPVRYVRRGLKRF